MKVFIHDPKLFGFIKSIELIGFVHFYTILREDGIVNKYRKDEFDYVTPLSNYQSCLNESKYN